MLIAEEMAVELQIWFASKLPEARVYDLRGMLPSRPLVQRGQRGYYKIDITERQGICLHHSAAWGSFKGMANYHLQQWPSAGGIAYTLGVDRHGDVSIFWDFDIRTYAQGWRDDQNKPETLGDENILWLPVIISGNFSSPSNQGEGVGEPSLNQLSSTLAIVSFFENFGLADITGHYEHGKAACPGTVLAGIIRAAQNNIVLPILPGKFNLATTRGRQEALKLGQYYNPPLKVDGLWGNGSKAALVNFQKDHTLLATALWNKQTEKALTFFIATLLNDNES